MDLKTKINPAPIKDPFIVNGEMNKSWANWFSRVFDCVSILAPSVSPDNGDTSVTLTVRNSAATQRFNTPLTSGRIVTLSSVNAFTGSRFRVVRQNNAAGVFGIDVGPGLKTLTAPGQWVDAEYTGSNWIITARGTCE